MPLMYKHGCMSIHDIAYASQAIRNGNLYPDMKAVKHQCLFYYFLYLSMPSFFSGLAYGQAGIFEGASVIY